MDKTLMFVQRENISQTLASLQKEENPEERSLLKRILVEEENRYGFYSEQLDMAHRHILDVQGRYLLNPGLSGILPVSSALS